jgi:hypothetical protein
MNVANRLFGQILGQIFKIRKTLKTLVPLYILDKKRLSVGFQKKKKFFLQQANLTSKNLIFDKSNVISQGLLTKMFI